MPVRARPIHVHVMNDPTVSPIFHVTRRQFRAAFRDTPARLKQLRVTIGMGSEGYDRAMRTADILVAYRFPHRRVAEQAPRLRWIHQIGAGIDHLVPLDWLPERVRLTNSSGAHVPKAGEFIVCALLMLNNLIPQHVTNQRLRRWEQIFTDPVAGKTVVVIGMGRIGGEAARRAKQLGMRVIGVRRSGARHRDVDRMYRVEALAKALPQADFVLVAAPLTAETRGLIGRRELDLLKPAAGLVNMGRAGIVDYEALAAKLERRELAGAVLDVFHPEPLPSRTALWRCPNLIITPHVSSDALDYMSHVLRIFATNVGRYVSGRPLKNAVSRQDQY